MPDAIRDTPDDFDRAARGIGIDCNQEYATSFMSTAAKTTLPSLVWVRSI